MQQSRQHSPRPVGGAHLAALGSELMRPELVAAFVGEFTAEWNRLAGSRGADLSAKRRELAQVERKHAGLIDAIADGLRSAGLREKLEELESRRAVLQVELEQGALAATAPVFHGKLAETYRARVAGLRDAMQKSASPEIREALRALIARVDIHPAGAGKTEPRIELVGHLASLLRAGGAEVPAMFLCSAKGDAGTGFEPVTFRL